MHESLHLLGPHFRVILSLEGLEIMREQTHGVRRSVLPFIGKSLVIEQMKAAVNGRGFDPDSFE
jgi:hypothetical protein